jgi:hypothetical protein
MKRILALLLLAGLPAVADSFTASLYSPLAGSGTVTPITLTGISTPSHAPIVGTGYSVSFTGVASNQGVVQGDSSGLYAVPVAGVTGGGAAEYLMADWGSALTPNIVDSGNYFSTGSPGTITITLNSPAYWFALLWGSIDTTNSMALTVGTTYTITGAQVQTATAGFGTNGFQGPTGSAWVLINVPEGFQTVTATSGIVSFEFAGAVASTGGFSTPEPASVLLMGTLLLGLAGALKRKWA